MSRPTPSSTQKSRLEDLQSMVTQDDVLGVLIIADPDAIASALAFKRLFWRKVKKIIICRVNKIKRSDNLALLRRLHVNIPYITRADTATVTRWAIIDSQPHHHPIFSRYDISIIIDHHPPAENLGKAEPPFMDVRTEYGAVSSIMTEYLRAADITPSGKIATALFYGIKTDTDNFTRTSTSADIRAFRNLYPHVNLNIIKKIESSEINRKNISDFRKAFDALHFIGDTAYIYLGKVRNTDSMVILADFFTKMAEADWCMVAGIYQKKVIIIIRNAGFRLDAGKVAAKLFGDLGSAGGHKNAARAEIPLSAMTVESGGVSKIADYIGKKIKER
jgi:nanoRNase/pAp phosphatase (c-di-AMP/oligoRNAs hydrolase)